jgi:Signal peptidase, peptidase S26
MAPTLEPGDWLVAVRPSRIRRGDVVVVRHPTSPFDVVKRVVGLSGERLHGFELQHDEFLLVGDNMTGSTDGRVFGPVNGQAIEGVVRFRYWPSPRRIAARMVQVAGDSSRSRRQSSPSETSIRRPSASRSRKQSRR